MKKTFANLEELKRNTFSFFDDKLFIQRMAEKPKNSNEIFKRLETDKDIVLITDDNLIHPSLSNIDFLKNKNNFIII